MYTNPKQLIGGDNPIEVYRCTLGHAHLPLKQSLKLTHLKPRGLKTCDSVYDVIKVINL